MKKMLNVGNQIIFISSSGSGIAINYDSDFLRSYGSSSASQKITVPTVPVSQHSNTVHKKPFKKT